MQKKHKKGNKKQRIKSEPDAPFLKDGRQLETL
jgi:hypothetical protein